MIYHQRNTATFHSKYWMLLLWLALSGCFDTLSVSKAGCASNDDCTGAESCLDGRCLIQCIADDECDATQRCVYNRCESMASVFPDSSVSRTDATSVDVGPITDSTISIDVMVTSDGAITTDAELGATDSTPPSDGSLPPPDAVTD